MLVTNHAAASLTTDACLLSAALQHGEGYWHGNSATRAPIQDGDISHARSRFALAAYATPALKDEFAGRIARGEMAEQSGSGNDAGSGHDGARMA